jgi:putative ABC transport system permease protein
VGIFSAQGTAAESEIWGPLDDLMADFRREKLSAITMRLRSAVDVPAVERRVERDRRLSDYEVKSETEYFQQQADWLGFMGLLAAIIGGCMGLGASLGGMNAFYTSVAQRTPEIGMLRVLGFGSGSILSSFMLEALLIGLVGSLAGATVGLAANFMKASFWGSTFSFRVTPQIYVTAIIVGTVFALLGGLLPAIRAARLPPITALRKG